MNRIFIAIANLICLVMFSGCSPQLPNAPLNLNGQAISYTEINLIWNDNADNEDGYRIYRDGISIASLGPNATSYHDNGLNPNKTYLYEVKAYNRAGESGSSINVGTPYLSFNAQFNGWFVAGNQIGATARKTDAVVAEVSLTGGEAGTYTIRIRRDISMSSDQTIQEISFLHDGSSSTKQISFVPPYATDESGTRGYHIDILLSGVPIWTMDNSYPPRLWVIQ